MKYQLHPDRCSATAALAWKHLGTTASNATRQAQAPPPGEAAARRRPVPAERDRDAAQDRVEGGSAFGSQAASFSGGAGASAGGAADERRRSPAPGRTDVARLEALRLLQQAGPTPSLAAAGPAAPSRGGPPAASVHMARGAAAATDPGVTAEAEARRPQAPPDADAQRGDWASPSAARCPRSPEPIPGVETAAGGADGSQPRATAGAAGVEMAAAGADGSQPRAPAAAPEAAVGGWEAAIAAIAAWAALGPRRGGGGPIGGPSGGLGAKSGAGVAQASPWAPTRD